MQQTVLEMVREAKAEGRTVFFSSHILSEVQAVCDRVGIIRDGQLVATQRVEDLFAQRMNRISLIFDGMPPAGTFDIEGVTELERGEQSIMLEVKENLPQVLAAAGAVMLWILKPIISAWKKFSWLTTARRMEAKMFRLLVQEMKFRRNAIIGWGLGLCFFPIVYIGIYPQLPTKWRAWRTWRSIRHGCDLGTFADWVGSILVLFVPLLVSVFAMINGTGTLAGEEEDGRLEMIVTLPLPRWKIVTAKAMALSISTFIIS